MKKINFLIPLLIGTYTYSFLSFTLGPSGLWAMKQLVVEYNKVIKNVEDLEILQENLTDTLHNLELDQDTIAVYAHELGFVFEGEKLIKLANYSGGIKRSYDPGSIVLAKSIDFVPEWFCKLFSCLITLVLLCVLHIKNRNNKIISKL